MKGRSFLTFLVIVVCLIQPLSAQIIRGSVTDSINGEPLIGATVVQIDRNNRFINGTTVDINGFYTLQVNEENAKIGFSYIGYEGIEMNTRGRTEINVKLVSRSIGLDAVVVTADRTDAGDGVTNIPIRNLATAVTAIDMKNLEEVPTSSVAEALQGRMSGVDIDMASGDPGAGMNITIRGNTSMFRVANPLVVLDGVPYETSIGADFDFQSADVADYGSLVDISPADISSIQILKDAASAAVWGSRGANGVIVINTKRGQTRRTQFNLDYRGSFVSEPKPLPMLDGDQYVRLMLDQRFNRDPVTISIPNEYLNEPGFINYHNFNNNTNWVEAVTQNGKTDDINFSVSGGGNRAKYRASLGYYDQLGTTIGTGFTRITTRLNLDYTISDRLKLSTDFSYTNSDRAQNISGVRSLAYRKAPHMSVFEHDAQGFNTGNYFSPQQTQQGTGINYPNPVALALDGINSDKRDRVLTSFLTQYELAKGLSYFGNVSFDITNNRNTRLLPQSATGVLMGNDQLNRIQNREDQQNVIQTYNKLVYKPALNHKHDLTMLGMFSTYDRYATQMGLSAAGIPSYYLPNTTNTGINDQATSAISRVRTLSYLVNMHYIYDDKYILASGVRVDGDSRFGRNHRHGYFPSISLAWRMSSEAFMSDINWLADLKPRVSYGMNGYPAQRSYQYFASYESAGGYMDNNGIQLANVALNNLRWETTKQLNTGVDVSLFDYRLNMTFDYYDKFTEDIIFTDLQIPSTSGFSTMSMNWGSMSNKGWEFSLSSTLINRDELRLSIDFNIARNQNIIRSIPENYATEVFSVENGRYARRILEGYPIGAFYGFKYLGVYATPSDAIAYDSNGNVIINPITGLPLPMRVLGSDAKAGDVIYQDINFDGNINQLDIVYLGNANPDFIGGFGVTLRLKSFTVSSFFNYKIGQDVINETRMYTENMHTYDNQSTAVLRRWRKNGDQTDIPRAVLNQGRNWLGSDRFVEDASFLRLKTLTISYNIPKTFTERYGLNNVRTFMTAYNIVTLTRYSGQDPEIGFSGSDPFALGIDRSMTPPPVSFTLGISMTF